MRESRVDLIQPEDWDSPDSCSGNVTPLFLIHDGGGTTFVYNFLPPLDRFVYGIANPHFETGEIFFGGVAEMGQLYAKWIRDTVAQKDFPARRNCDEHKSVDIIIGGWSFGGLLSLEIAKQLETCHGVRVIGVLAIDSIFPSWEATAAPALPPATDKDKTKNQVMSERAMEEARNMVQMWTVPVWGPGTRRPPTMLLKAQGYIFSAPGSAGTVSPLDLDRGEDGKLGWDQHKEPILEEILEVEGHHFELFMGDKLESTARAIRQALDRFEASKRVQ